MIGMKLMHVILAAVAFAVTMIAFRPILKIALSKNIVDNPDARKLQKTPVPVMGGIVVFFGIVVGLCFFKTLAAYTSLFPVLGAMVIMLYLGAMDDILSINPKLRFGIETVVALLLIYGMHCCIRNFQGIWGIEYVPVWVGIVLSVITFLGVVNSINMIDGIDGLSSSFTILIVGCLGVVCYYGDAFSYSSLAAVTIGAILPFFLHNVFGWKTKMFIGDGGTMMIGTIISALVFVILRPGFNFNPAHPFDFSRIAFVIAVLSIPIADTLRVMTCRALKGNSPFSADKTHLHHIFLRFDLSYISITIIEILLNIVVIAAFLIAWKCGAPASVQLYVVVAVAALSDWGLAAILEAVLKADGKCAAALKRFGAWSHVEREGLWLHIQHLIDGSRN